MSTARGFQFRIGTLLVAMVWAGLISLGLRTPTTLWSTVIDALTLLTVLTAALVGVYRVGKPRAMAIGFLVFCIGYLSYVAFLGRALMSPLGDEEFLTPLFHFIHLDSRVPLLVGGEMILPPVYNASDFISICHHAIAGLLGVVGAIVAQVLYATRKDATIEVSLRDLPGE
jgi:hypothetical protein